MLFIVDNENNVFLKLYKHYGYDFYNQQISKLSFTNDFDKALKIKDACIAQDLLVKIKKGNNLITNNLLFNINNLQVVNF